MPYADPAQRAACSRRFYESHEEEMKARSRKHYTDNLEDRQAKRYAQYWSDPAEAAKYAAHKYYIANKNTILSRQKQANIRAQRADRQLEREARKRQQFIEHIDRQILFEWDKGICGICQNPVDRDSFHVDHIIPLSKGGEHSYANVQVAHPKCNLSKGATL